MLLIILSLITFLLAVAAMGTALLAHHKIRHRPDYTAINNMSRELGIEPLKTDWKDEPLSPKELLAMMVRNVATRYLEEQKNNTKRY